MPGLPLSVWPLVALLCSLVANGLLGWGYLAGRDQQAALQERVQTVAQERDSALAGAQACSDGVQRLQALAESRAKEAVAARKQAAQAAADHARRADEVLAAPPAVPGDDCASARVRIGRWLRQRGSFSRRHENDEGAR